MQRSIFVWVSFPWMLVSSEVAIAQTAFVDGYYGPDDPNIAQVAVTSQSYVDLPFTQKTLTLPAGTALITRSGVGGARTNNAYPAVAWGSVRPVIGQAAPNEGMRASFESLVPNPVADQGTFAGSWSTTIVGGTVTVGLQARYDGGDANTLVFSNGNSLGGHYSPISWNIIVFPQATGGAPAVSNAGIVVMLGISILAGSIILLRRAARTS